MSVRNDLLVKPNKDDFTEIQKRISKML